MKLNQFISIDVLIRSYNLYGKTKIPQFCISIYRTDTYTDKYSNFGDKNHILV